MLYAVRIKNRAKAINFILFFLICFTLYKCASGLLPLKEHIDTSSKNTKPPKISYVNNEASIKTIAIRNKEELTYHNSDYINDTYRPSNTIKLDHKNNNGLIQKVVNVDGQSITFGSIPNQNVSFDENLEVTTPSSYNNDQSISFSTMAIYDKLTENQIEMIGKPYDSGHLTTFGPTPLINEKLTEEIYEQ